MAGHPFKNDDKIEFGQDGGHGEFILYGWPDYNACLYFDALIEHIPSLAVADYPGLPIEPQLVSTLSGISAAPTVSASFFTMSGIGPVFEDPYNPPENTSKVRYRIRFRVPSTVIFSHTEHRLLAQASTGFDIRMRNTNQIQLLSLEDTHPLDNKVLYTKPIMDGFPRDAWIDLDITADHGSDELRILATGLPNTVLPYSRPSTRLFQTGRKFTIFGQTTTKNFLPAGIEVEYVELYYNDVLRKRIAGNAAFVNADPWKYGENAV